MRPFLLFLIFFIPVLATAQEFPKLFIGHWEGELLWFQTGKKAPQKVKMQLIIRSADTAGQYSWQLIYGDQNEDNRPYLLKPVDTSKGHWIIDERNGIVLDQYWVGNRFTSAFTVQNSTILDSYWIENGKLVAEFYSISAKPVRTSGSGTSESPNVDSYGTRSYQKAVLRKKKS